MRSVESCISKRMDIEQKKVLTPEMHICGQHSIKFKKWKHYIVHMEKECELWLTRRNVCTFHKDGKTCGKFFNETANLILHYFKIHDLYACTCCYSTFKNAEELERHEHEEGQNFRLSKYKR